ncbi:MAG TPA: hypothetical protein VHX38_06510 [Pseudonocardiaceae bacterium]|nr:hypothetical protein [Pseudonocardiaceae bacterium]
MSSPAKDSDRLSLDLLPKSLLHKRAGGIAVVAIVLAAAVGGLIGLATGRLGGLIAAAVVGLPMLGLAYVETRRTSWLDNGIISMRGLRIRSVDLRQLTRIELLIAEVRGKRVVMFVIIGGPKGKRVNLIVANYTINSSLELDIVVLRRLADALASGETAHGLVFAELLVAQLRAEARELPLPTRPLYRLASLAVAGRLAQRMHPDAITQFVATLD